MVMGDRGDYEPALEAQILFVATQRVSPGRTVRNRLLSGNQALGDNRETAGAFLNPLKHCPARCSNDNLSCTVASA